MKEINEKACGLDLPPGLSNQIDYPQKFVRAPKSQYPKHYPRDDQVPKDAIAMKMSLGK